MADTCDRSRHGLPFACTLMTTHDEVCSSGIFSRFPPRNHSDMHALSPWQRISSFFPSFSFRFFILYGINSFFFFYRGLCTILLHVFLCNIRYSPMLHLLCILSLPIVLVIYVTRCFHMGYNLRRNHVKKNVRVTRDGSLICSLSLILKLSIFALSQC